MPPLTGEEIRARLTTFAARWSVYDRSERAEAQTYLNELFECYGTRLAMLHLASGHVAWLREEIAALDDLGTFEAQVITNLYAEERDRIARVAKACLDAGVAERQVKLAETYGAALANLLRAVFNDHELGMTNAQRERLPEILRRYLGALEGSHSLIPAA